MVIIHVRLEFVQESVLHGLFRSAMSRKQPSILTANDVAHRFVCHISRCRSFSGADRSGCEKERRRILEQLSVGRGTSLVCVGDDFLAACFVDTPFVPFKETPKAMKR